MTSVRILQSHCDPLPAGWYEVCVSSVRAWAAARGYQYQWLGDEIFDLVPGAVRSRTTGEPVVTSDIARLVALERALAEDGVERAVWLDADTLVTAPESFVLPGCRDAFGREVWVEPDRRGRPRAFDKIHNAFLLFGRDSVILPFYRYAAERLLLRHDGPMVPQLLGPKFLAVLHNLLELPVLESAAVLSPAVIVDVLAGKGAALDLFRARSAVAPAAVNLCGSMVRRGRLSDAQMEEVIRRLGRAPEVLDPVSRRTSRRPPAAS